MIYRYTLSLPKDSTNATPTNQGTGLDRLWVLSGNLYTPRPTLKFKIRESLLSKTLSRHNTGFVSALFDHGMGRSTYFGLTTVKFWDKTIHAQVSHGHFCIIFPRQLLGDDYPDNEVLLKTHFIILII